MRRNWNNLATGLALAAMAALISNLALAQAECGGGACGTDFGCGASTIFAGVAPGADLGCGVRTMGAEGSGCETSLGCGVRIGCDVAAACASGFTSFAPQ